MDGISKSSCSEAGEWPGMFDMVESSVKEPQRERERQRKRALIAIYGQPCSKPKYTKDGYISTMIELMVNLCKHADQRVPDKLTAKQNEELRMFVEHAISRLKLFLAAIEQELNP